MLSKTDKERLFQEFKDASLPAELFLTNKEECAVYGGDWTRLSGEPLLVALPRTVSQVAQILKLCSKLKISVVPSGGRTGLAGGAVVTGNELVLSLSRMNQIFPVDLLGNTVRVQAGAVTESVHEHCAKSGLTWPIDLAAKGTSQIGGNLSTNAGGVRVIRYGMARKWVSGLQVVTMQGEIIELNRGLEKNNTGYDLIQLLIGAEGTLAVITEATLKLTRLPQKIEVLFFSVPNLEAMSLFFEQARKGPFDILAFEFFSQRCLDTVQQKLKRISRLQIPGPFYILMEIELAKGEAAASEVETWLNQVIEGGTVSDGLMAQSTAEQKEVWGLREGITESISLTGPVRKYDVAVPVSKGVQFLNEAQTLFSSLKLPADLYLFGHFGDGSPHLNIVKHPETSSEEFNQECDRFEKELFPLLKKFGGSVSAEHGVGLLKKHWVEYSRTPAELIFFRAIKKAFDPNNLLNPGKLINLST